MTPLQAADAIRRSRGLFVGVTFVKRSTGEERRMVCRYGLTRHVHGEAAYDPDAHRLLVVRDVHKRAWRSIPIEGLTELRIAGATVAVG